MILENVKSTANKHLKKRVRNENLEIPSSIPYNKNNQYL